MIIYRVILNKIDDNLQSNIETDKIELIFYNFQSNIKQDR